MKQLLIIIMLAFCCMAVNAKSKAAKRPATTKKTSVQKKTATTAVDYDKLLVGNHMFSSQWISWKKFGKATITKTDTPNVYNISGMQDGTTCSDLEEAHDNADFLMIEGTITPKSKTHLVFKGKIIQKIYHLSDGKPCVREGTFNFMSTQGRRYWRLQERSNPCDSVCDYIDIYFK